MLDCLLQQLDLITRLDDPCGGNCRPAVNNLQILFLKRIQGRHIEVVDAMIRISSEARGLITHRPHSAPSFRPCVERRPPPIAT